MQWDKLCEWCEEPAIRQFHVDFIKSEGSGSRLIVFDRYSCSKEEHTKKVRRLIHLDGAPHWTETGDGKKND